MNVIRYSDPDFSQRRSAMLAPSSLFDPEIETRTRAIIEDVQKRGDEAVLELTARFDGAHLAAEQLPVTRAELMSAALQADAELRSAVEFARKNIAAYSKRCLRRDWMGTNAQGARVGEKFDPYERVGIYIPGGTAPLVSTALMTITLAKAAGCEEIAVCTPCGRDGTIHPGLLHAANVAGATEIYRVGGAQAIAALSLGTPTIRRVQKVFGPGNAYVVAAKRLLVGYVAIDLLPGPSEVLVLADETAEAAFAAADLLAQAEHGSGYERVWLVSPSAKVIQAVKREMARQIPKLKRRVYIEKALKRGGWLVQTETLDDAIQLANELAPEHLEIMTRRPREIAKRIRTAGAIFLGRWSPTVLGDYVAGPSHTLPTGGAGLSFPGLTSDMFQRRTSLVEYGRPALRRSVGAVGTFADREGLDAHRASADIRLR
jgi:histidinol dehydrogenase